MEDKLLPLASVALPEPTEVEQSLAKKATENPYKIDALCLTCGIRFNSYYQAKHSTCPNCNSGEWVDLLAIVPEYRHKAGMREIKMVSK